MARPILNPPEFPDCFVCGPANPHGLHLTIRRDGDDAIAEYRTPPHQEGYPDRFHGGLVGLLVDEMLVYAGVVHGLRGMTARVAYRLRKPIPTETTIHLRSRLTTRSGRGFRAEVELRLDDGTLAAEGDGTCMTTT